RAPSPAPRVAMTETSATGRATPGAHPAATSASARNAAVPGYAGPPTYRASPRCRERAPAGVPAATCSIARRNPTGSAAAPVSGATRRLPTEERRIPPTRRAATVGVAAQDTGRQRSVRQPRSALPAVAGGYPLLCPPGPFGVFGGCGGRGGAGG